MKNIKINIRKVIVIAVLLIFALISSLEISSSDKNADTSGYEQSGQESSESEEKKSVLPLGIEIGASNIIILLLIGSAVGANKLLEARKEHSRKKD